LVSSILLIVSSKLKYDFDLSLFANNLLIELEPIVNSFILADLFELVDFSELDGVGELDGVLELDGVSELLISNPFGTFAIVSTFSRLSNKLLASFNLV